MLFMSCPEPCSAFLSVLTLFVVKKKAAEIPVVEISAAKVRLRNRGAIGG